MNTRYKIILSNRNIYKEFELSPDAQVIKIGTGINCDFRLRKDLFFDDICFTLTRTGDGWVLVCSDNLYISVGDIRKLVSKELNHGDVFSIRYRSSDNELFTFDYRIDFNDGNIRYERAFDISGYSRLTIGTYGNSVIQLNSSYLYNDNIELTKQGDSLLLTVISTTNGVSHNGNIVSGSSVINNGDFFSVSDCFFYYKDGLLWTEKGSKMIGSGITFSDMPDLNSYPSFIKSTRIQTKLNDEKISILDPPAIPQKPKRNLLMTLLPSLGMLIASGAMAAMGSPMMIIFSGISAVIAIITALMGMRQGKKEYEEGVAKRSETYTNYIAQKRAEIEGCRNDEKLLLENIYISEYQEEFNLNSFSRALFDRTSADEDFLDVRLGIGAVEAKRVIDYKKQEKLEIEDELQLIPETVCFDYKYIYDAPIVCHFKDADAVGIAGSEDKRFELFKVIVTDIIARQHFDDVKMIFVAEEKNKERIRALRMLPFVRNDALEVPNIVCDEESKTQIFEYLYKELTQREDEDEHENYIVIFLYDKYDFINHPVSKFVKQAKDLGITFVFFGDTQQDISQGCRYIISVDNGNTGYLTDSKDKTTRQAFLYQPVDTAFFERTAYMLAPVYTENVSLESTLTKNITIFDLLGIIAVDDIDLKDRWASTKVYRSMSAPIGVSKTGVVSLDLHDTAHGPHGLVAGTTGSGKSELLQTYLLSMITLFHPYEVGFVIIDFKGGGMVNQFKDVPHLLGAITNIDGKAINRSLKSIKAELQKRQHLFAEAEVNHIDKYIRKFKAGDVETPLPHLIIIVDEFAELKAEQPEFMKELISAARIGRSLGVHLILATQKPAGQVNEQIWSNSRFKLCLKVQDQQDSNEVLHSPLAAEIKEPGRAYLQVGNNEIFELFQSAYSGAPDKPEDSSTREFTICEISESGKKSVVFEQKKEKSEEETTTQLSAIVDYISQYCAGNEINKLPDICLPALEEVILYREGDASQSGIVADIGIYDDPDNQFQGVYSVNLTEQNVMLIGSSQSGKTNVLQTMIRDLSTKYTPDEVNVYIIDFASMVLKNFESLKHVGGVVTASEDEKLKNLMKLLLVEIEGRKEKLLSAGVSSFAAYKEAGYTDLPQLVLMIDNLTALKELYFQDDDTLLTLCREGMSVGLSLVIANSQTTGIGFRYLSNFNCKIALFCNDSSEYYSLFDHCRERLEDIHGRSLIEIDKTHFECQMYLSFEGEKEFERVNAIRQYISGVNEKYPASGARIIPVIPEVLTAAYINESFPRETAQTGQVVVGLDYANVAPFTLNLTTIGVCGFVGQESKPVNAFIRYILSSLEYHHQGENEVYLFDGISRELSELKEHPFTEKYSVLPDEAVSAFLHIEEKLESRYQMIAQGNEAALEKEKLIIVVLNSPDTVESVCASAKALAAYKNFIGKYKNLKICVLLGNIDNKLINYSAPEIYRTVRDRKQLFYFGNIGTMKIFDVPLQYLRAFKKPVSESECFYFDEEQVYKLKAVKK